MAELNIMLAKRWPEIDKSKVHFPAYVEPKYDGIRAIIFREEDEQTVLTRYGNKINLPVYDIPPGIYDSEIIKPGKDFDTLSGEIRSGDYEGIRLMVFDYLTWDEWDRRQAPLQEARRKRLEDIARQYFKEPLHITDVSIAYSEGDVEELYNKAIMAGEEGIVIKPFDAEYRWGLRGDWYKYKKEDFEDVEIIGFTEGTGKFSDSLGALVVRDSQGREFKVGVGFSDQMRKDIWNNKSKYIGKIVEIAFMERTDSAVRFPRFIRFKF